MSDFYLRKIVFSACKRFRRLKGWHRRLFIRSYEQLMITATLKQHNATITQQAAVININNCSLLGYGSKLETERQWLEQDINQIQTGEWEKSQKNPSDLERSLMLN